MTIESAPKPRYYLVTFHKRLAKVVRVYATDEQDAKQQAEGETRMSVAREQAIADGALLHAEGGMRFG